MYRACDRAGCCVQVVRPLCDTAASHRPAPSCPARSPPAHGPLRHDLGLPPPLLRAVVAQGGVCKYPVATLADRAAYWTSPPPAGLGFSSAELRAVLAGLPRLFLYPLRDAKYQAKLRFLTGVLPLLVLGVLG